MQKKIAVDPIVTTVIISDSVASTSKSYDLHSVSDFCFLKLDIKVMGVRKIVRALEFDLSDLANPLSDTENADETNIGKVIATVSNYGPGTWRLSLSSDNNLSDVYIVAEFRKTISYVP